MKPPLSTLEILLLCVTAIIVVAMLAGYDAKIDGCGSVKSGDPRTVELP